MKKAVRTPEQVRREFAHAGISISAWARKNGFHPLQVYAVLNGRLKAKYGTAHAIAVALGLKAGEIVSVESFRPVRKVA